MYIRHLSAALLGAVLAAPATGAAGQTAPGFGGGPGEGPVDGMSLASAFGLVAEHGPGAGPGPALRGGGGGAQAPAEAPGDEPAVAAVPAEASHPAVVVELYTSQGCSSCPPADDILADLADRKGVIPLALHVNYWDYIGWTDKFGSQQYTDRQKAYARAIGSRTIYTPQIIIDGDDRVAGARPMDVAELIQQHRADPAPVALKLSRSGDRVSIEASADQPLPARAMVQLVRYLPQKTVAIARGENAGRTITYYNIVTEWKMLGTWDGTAPLTLTAPVEGAEPVVVIVQEQGPGAILAAARLQ